ncbi:MAG: SDR family NAD(P)-dependent oxidoreductase, partial [Flavisolibacter sp.]|nr:SDR family NAD(P)-dependent oxidoreductase [Flavisolibacter sp.]
MRFIDKVCLVTGAGSGIGRATIERMAAEGGLAVVIDRDEKGGNATVAN